MYDVLPRDEILERFAASRDLREVNLRHADLSGADLYSVNLSGANLGNTNLRGAKLHYADLSGADLRGAKLHHADLHDADLSGANLRYANLPYANLHYADLRGADLSDADLHHVNLRYTNLTGTILNLSSHDVLAEILRRAAGDDMAKLSIAGLTLLQSEWCWSEWTDYLRSSAVGDETRAWLVQASAPWPEFTHAVKRAVGWQSDES